MTTLVKLKRAIPVLALGVSMLLSVSSMHAQQASEHAGSGQKSTPAAQSSEAKQDGGDENDAYRHSAMVQKLGGMMGMSTDKAATAFEVVNFAILAILIGGFLLKSLPKVFRDRTATIQKHLVDARTATQEASARLNSVEDRLSKLDGQIAEMRAQADRDSAADELRIKSTVEEETRKILSSADVEIAAATLQAQRQLQQYAAELAIEQAAKKLVISAETDRLLVQGFVRRLGGDDVKGGQN